MSSWDAMVKSMWDAKGGKDTVPAPEDDQDEEKKKRKNKMFERIQSLLGYGPANDSSNVGG